MGEYWFKPRRYGYGATPTSWQGWAVVAAFVLVLLGTAKVLITDAHPHPGLFIVAVLAEVAGLILVCRAKTDGAWRWRWGGE